MPSAKNVSEISNLQRGSELDPYQVLGLPVRSFKSEEVYCLGIITEELKAYYPSILNSEIDDYKDVCLIPAMLWLIQEMHGEIQELKKKVNK